VGPRLFDCLNVLWPVDLLDALQFGTQACEPFFGYRNAIHNKISLSILMTDPDHRAGLVILKFRSAPVGHWPRLRAV
jgi:hypothetical protein